MNPIYEEITLETTGHSLIGMHPVGCLDEFLPWDTLTPEAYKETVSRKSHLTKLRFKLVPSKPGNFESTMYPPFNSWQEVSSCTAPEADIYQILEDTNVEHVASKRLSGDIDALETKAQTCFSDLTHSSRHRKPARIPLCHRIVLNTVARDLSTFSWCKVLLSCVADAVEGAQQAYAAGILHRDISVGNITIVQDKKTKEQRGVLIDWDMSLLAKHEVEAQARRIGTWAFTSAKILRTPHRVAHTLWDDMESAFWVLIYLALLYLKHDYKPGALFHIRQRLFDAKVCEADGSVTGGHAKKTVMAFCTFECSQEVLPSFGVLGLNITLEKLGSIFDVFWRAPRPKAWKMPELEKPKLVEPDQKCIPDLLRRAAMTMEPLSVTPTGLASPTNDSKPPANPKEWQSANVDTVKVDLHPMPYALILR